jgi:hypothetical protein
MSNRVELHVGRLLEVRADSGYRSVVEVQEIFAQIAAHVSRLASGVRCVMIVDWRQCPIMSSEAADLLLENIKQNNARLERCAALAGRESPVALLQFLRLVRAADNPNRRLCEDVPQALAWLDPVLTREEAARLREFLAPPLALTSAKPVPAR